MEMNTHEVIINCEIKDTVVEHIHEKDISKKKSILPIPNNENITHVFNNKLICYNIVYE